jgi:geranylgeranyl diphosphate synthase type I
VWGNSAVTGKSTESDLVSGKKTLPVVYAMRQEGEFSRRWLNGDITVADVPVLAECLEGRRSKVYGERSQSLDRRSAKSVG